MYRTFSSYKYFFIGYFLKLTLTIINKVEIDKYSLNRIHHYNKYKYINLSILYLYCINSFNI